jgi:hypothetical protein
MPTIQQMREVVSRIIDDDGRVRDSTLREEFVIKGTLGEIVSLSPPRVELLDGRTIRPRGYVGPVPALGQIVLVLRIAKWPLVVTGIEVI